MCKALFRSPPFQMSSQAPKRQKTSKVSFRPQKPQIKPLKPAIKAPPAVAGPSKSIARSPPPAASVSIAPKPPSTAIPSGVMGKGKEGAPFRFKIIAGSYEKILYGLQVDVPASTSSSSQPSTAPSSGGTRNKIKLKPIFVFPAHISCVKAVAASPLGGKWLATGGTDETVKVWDLKRRKELGGLVQHQGWFFVPFLTS
jgi:protein MAK11